MNILAKNKCKNDTKWKIYFNANSFEKIAKEVFDIADKDHNGYIDKEELDICIQQIIKSFSDYTPEKTIVSEEFNRLDIDKNGIIDYSEFKVFVWDIINMVFKGMELWIKISICSSNILKYLGNYLFKLVLKLYIIFIFDRYYYYY